MSGTSGSYDEKVRWCLLAFFDFEGLPVYVNSTPWTLRHNGIEYIGVGSVAEIENIQSNTDGGDTPFSLALNSVPNDAAGEIAGLVYQGRSMKVWSAELDDDYQIVATQVEAVGRMELITSTHGKTTRIQIDCSTGINWSGTSPRKVNQQWQEREYPGDRGCVYVAANANVEIEL